ncbi:MAG: OsmC family protein [Alphaproteobacteria bacterium]
MIARTFKVACDEPVELCGENTAANPQELLMSALNACMMVGYVAGCAVRGIALEQLELETSGELDLRGFLGIDEAVKPGYDALQVKVKIKGNGTPEQFREIHRVVLKTSPNYFNVTQPIPVEATLSIG